MNHKAGDRVKIKSLDWYNENKDKDGRVNCPPYMFFAIMCHYCGAILTINSVDNFDKKYKMTEDGCHFDWTDEMIECKVEEETKPNVIEEAKTYRDSIKDAWICPEGYIFKDENGNVINATKIVLEKKKKEYPKTYEECEKVLRYDSHRLDNMGVTVRGYKWELIRAFQMLLICRDAYWKIAGDEMELEKPWEPDWENPDHDSYPTITRCGGKIIKTTIYTHDCPFAFPTPEMRDAFKENFDPDIEFCKELL